jgi:ElaB/YqjD/DUF883 family membrane-anchored ribosome-binding protein
LNLEYLGTDAKTTTKANEILKEEAATAKKNQVTMRSSAKATIRWCRRKLEVEEDYILNGGEGGDVGENDDEEILKCGGQI